METDFRAITAFNKQKKAVKKRMLFPLDKNSDSTSLNEGFVQKIGFHYAEKLPSGIFKVMRGKWFPIVGEKLLYKKWLHLNLNNEKKKKKKKLDKKSVSTRDCFQC